MADETELLKAMSVLHLEPGDTLVLNVARQLSSDQAAALRTYVSHLLPNVPVLLLDDGIQVGVLRQAA